MFVRQVFEAYDLFHEALTAQRSRRSHDFEALCALPQSRLLFIKRNCIEYMDARRLSRDDMRLPDASDKWIVSLFRKRAFRFSDMNVDD